MKRGEKEYGNKIYYIYIYIIKNCEHRWVDDDGCAHFVIVIVIVIVFATCFV